MLSAPLQCPALGPKYGVRLRGRFGKNAVIHSADLLNNPSVHGIERGADFSRSRIGCRIGIRNRVLPVNREDLFTDQVLIAGLNTADPIQCQAVLGHRQVTDLPGHVGHSLCRLAKPLRLRHRIHQAHRVIPDTLDAANQFTDS